MFEDFVDRTHSVRDESTVYHAKPTLPAKTWRKPPDNPHGMRLQGAPGCRVIRLSPTLAVNL
jgi:hypothetical protein